MGIHGECTVDSSAIVRDLERSKYFSRQRQDKDSAVFYMNKAFSRVSADKSGLSYGLLLDIASYLRGEGNYTAALEFYMEALRRLDSRSREQGRDTATLRRYVQLYQDIAYSQSLYNPDQALDYLNRSLHVAEQIHAADSTYGIGKVRLQVYNNIGAIYTDVGKTDSAEYYYRKAFAYSVGASLETIGTLYNNLGIISAAKGDLPKAKDYFRRCMDCVGDSSGLQTLSNAYLNMGHCLYLEERYDEAVRYFLKAADYCRRSPSLRTALYTEESLSKAYERLGNDRQSLVHLERAHILQDSLLNAEQSKAVISMELSYQYQKQKEEYRFLHEIESKKKDFRTMFFMLSAIILLSLVVLLVVLYRLQRNKALSIKLEQESLALHNENLELRNKALKDELETRQKELNTHAQYLLKRNDLVSSVIEQITVAKDKDASELNTAIQRIRNNLQDSMSNELQALFQDLHNEFFLHLYERHPDLTPNEKRLCSFIHLHMSSKDISSVTGQSVKSIEIARSRLRAKLRLRREDNLNAYLQQF